MSQQKDKHPKEPVPRPPATPETAAEAREQTGRIEPCPPAVELGSVLVTPRSIPAFRCANYSNYTWSPIDESSAAELAAMDPESRCAYQKLGYLPDQPRYPLGDFQIDEHRFVSFEVIPALGEVGYSEVTEYPPGTATPPGPEEDETPSPLLRFLQVTDKTVPVPLMLHEFDERSDAPDVQRALVGRDLVDAMDDYGRQLSIASVAAQASSEPGAVWTCFSGGADVFSSTYCESKGNWACDSGGWYDLTRSSGSNKRRISHSRVASCSNYGVYVEHQFRYWAWSYAKWKWTAVKYPLPPAAWWQTLGYGQVKYWKHVGSSKKRRKIRIWGPPIGGSSYFRAWTAFYD